LTYSKVRGWAHEFLFEIGRIENKKAQGRPKAFLTRYFISDYPSGYSFFKERKRRFEEVCQFFFFFSFT